MADNVVKSDVMVLREFFGYKAGQTLKEFADEVRGLSQEEKTELSKLAQEQLAKK